MGLFSRDRSSSCAGCGRPKSDVRKIITGPGLAICDRCVESASAAIQRPGPPWSLDAYDPSLKARKTKRCSFCGQDSEEVGGLVILADGAICTKCVDLCVRIWAEERAAT
jgi:ATP-dependent protease Clp ATPase subunit